MYFVCSIHVKTVYQSNRWQKFEDLKNLFEELDFKVSKIFDPQKVLKTWAVWKPVSKDWNFELELTYFYQQNIDQLSISYSDVCANHFSSSFDTRHDERVWKSPAPKV